ARRRPSRLLLQCSALSRSARRRPSRLLLIAVLVAGCGDTTLLDPMERQPKFRPFASNSQYEDGRAMRQPPAGTVPRERQTMRPEITQGRDRTGMVVSAIPIQLTRQVLEQGRTRFEIHCAVCHGLAGDGVSPVATQMSLRPPPNLHRLRNPSPGHLFQVVSEGFGLMASYAAELAPEERWAVVAYVEALRRSQNATLGEAPADIQEKLRAEAAQ
ncbi:MAG TPA: cytochrome c, partial [Myxococcales bacterium]|nr:cytochrome c [Myxococcales bacterium]